MSRRYEEWEEGLEAPPRDVSVLVDPRFEIRPKSRGYHAEKKPPLTKEERRERQYQRMLARRPVENDRFHCSACGAVVVRPKDMSLYDWERLRRCETCIAVGRTEPEEGKRHCRRCGKIFTREKIVRRGSTRPSYDHARFCQHCEQERKS